jgi:hypothetical protein
MLDFFVCAVLFIAGYNLKNWFSGFNAYDKKILTLLYFWHIIIGCAYYYNVSDGGGDAWLYWYAPKNNGWSVVLSYMHRGSASGYVYFANYFPAHVMDLSFFTGSMLYMVIGYTAFIYLYKIIKENISRFMVLRKIKVLWIPIFPYFLFLPNIHYWTCGIGKDTLIFLGIVLFMYALMSIRKRLIYILVAVLLSVFIRPHILLYLILAFGTATVLEGRLKLYQKAILFMLFLVGAILLFPFVVRFTNFDNFQTESISTYSSQHISKLSRARTSSSLDVSSYPYPLKVFTFLFRPLFFDLKGALAMLASFENLLYLLFFIKVFFNKPFDTFRWGSITIKAMVVFFVLGTLTFPLLLGNLGIILRQKTPFMVMFLIFGFLVLVRAYFKKKQVRRRSLVPKELSREQI